MRTIRPALWLDGHGQLGTPCNLHYMRSVTRNTDALPASQWVGSPRISRRSGGEEYAATEQVETGAAVHLPLQELEPGDLTFGLAVARRREHRPDGGPVLLQPSREGLN